MHVADTLNRPPALFRAYRFPEATSLTTASQATVGNQSLQAVVLPLRILHPLGLIDLKPSVFLPLPIVALL